MGEKEKKIVRVDMSEHCGFKYEEYWYKANEEKTMSQEDWHAWYNSNCGNCIHMCEICMYGENVDEDVLKKIEEAGEDKDICPCSYGICDECETINKGQCDCVISE